ncbi:MAG: hypothetical protein ABIT37_08870 [Luteolibacter sp.]
MTRHGFRARRDVGDDLLSVSGRLANFRSLGIFYSLFLILCGLILILQCLICLLFLTLLLPGVVTCMGGKRSLAEFLRADIAGGSGKSLGARNTDPWLWKGGFPTFLLRGIRQC